jgi:hypothetical protein
VETPHHPVGKPHELFGHPSEDVLESYIFHRLPEVEEARLEEHLLICEPCQDALASLDEYVSLMKSATAGPRPVAHRRWTASHSRGLAWAGAVAAVCLVGILGPWRKNAPNVPTPVTLSSFRGSERVSMARAPAGVPLDLGIETDYLEGAGSWRIEIVDAAGRSAWNGSPTSATPGRMVARVAKDLDAGQYWVRVYGSAGLLQEFGLRLE